MKKLIIATLAVIAFFAPSAPAQTGTETIVSLKNVSTKGAQVAQVVTQPIKTFYPLGFEIDIRGFGGLQIANQALTGGVTASHPFGSLNLGLYGYLEQNRPIDGGLYFGLSVSLTKRKPPSEAAALMTISG